MYTLPVFPLQTVLFPKTPIHLHIFEERYKKMMRQVLETDLLFGVCLIHQGVEAYGPMPVPYPVGCSARIIDVQPLSEGRMNLTAIGEERFRIRSLVQHSPYLVAEVEAHPFRQIRTLETLRMKNALLEYLSEYVQLLDTYKAAGVELQTLNLFLEELKNYEDPTNIIFLTASLLQIPLIEKQHLLERETVPEILERLILKLRREILLHKRIFWHPEKIVNRIFRLN